MKRTNYIFFKILTTRMVLSLSCLLFSVAISASEFEVGGVAYAVTSRMLPDMPGIVYGPKKVSSDGISANTVKVIAKTECYSNNVIIPDAVSYNDTLWTVTGVDKQSFYNCTSLKSVTLGQNIAIVGNEAFSGCTQLEYISSKNSVPPMLEGTSTFTNIPSNCILYVPGGTENAYQTKWSWNPAYVTEDTLTYVKQLHLINEKINISSASGVLNIYVLEEIESNSLLIYSVNGQRVFDGLIENSISVPLSKGIYLLKIGNYTSKALVL